MGISGQPRIFIGFFGVVFAQHLLFCPFLLVNRVSIAFNDFCVNHKKRAISSPFYLIKLYQAFGGGTGTVYV